MLRRALKKKEDVQVQPFSQAKGCFLLLFTFDAHGPGSERHGSNGQPCRVAPLVHLQVETQIVLLRANHGKRVSSTRTLGALACFVQQKPLVRLAGTMGEQHVVILVRNKGLSQLDKDMW